MDCLSMAMMADMNIDKYTSFLLLFVELLALLLSH
jgi:hypothetical protein